MGYEFLDGNLRIGAWAGEWPYDSCTKKAVEDCKKKADDALQKINSYDAGKQITEAIKKLSFKIDLVPTTGDGAFLPVYGAKISGEVPIKRGDVGAIIIWDISKDFTPQKGTVKGTPKPFPPWVLLAHELGHGIQMNEKGGSGGAMKWHQAYKSDMEGVEMDNIKRHETPFVVKLGLPERIRYSKP
jgi:hypothetical protein